MKRYAKGSLLRTKDAKMKKYFLFFVNHLKQFVASLDVQ